MSRLAEYFAVYGIAVNDVSLSVERTKSSGKFHSGTTPISSVNLKVTDGNEDLFEKQTESYQIHRISNKNGKTLWLELEYGWGRKLGEIGLFYLPCEGEYIKIPIKFSLEPVWIDAGKFSHQEAGYN